jgi:menaquinone-9 beta-reductase
VELKKFDIIIIGGGLSGLVSSIDLAKKGYQVLVIEKKNYPLHKVCGEYISNEVRPYLQKLGFVPELHGASSISKFMISSASGASATCDIAVGGFGISRYKLDNVLYYLSLQAGVKVVVKSVVQSVEFTEELGFIVKTGQATYKAQVVLGAYGKRSNIDKSLDRKFFSERTNYVGIKHHFKGDHQSDLVCLHNFDGGYCGVSKVEDGVINVSYLTTKTVLNKYKSIHEMEAERLSENPHLHKVFSNAIPVFSQPLVIGQINFGTRQTVEKHILMIGDAAGMIYPLCGNGMAMAIHSAKLSAEQVHRYLSEEITRELMEQYYDKLWSAEFKTRLKFGNLMQPVFGQKWASNIALKTIKLFPELLPKVVSLSHGNYITA